MWKNEIAQQRLLFTGMLQSPPRKGESHPKQPETVTIIPKGNFVKTIQIIALTLFFTGCQKHEPQKPTVPARREYAQTCEMCGAKWLVTPNDPNDTVPPTIEWCFHDGHYCETGFAMILDAEKNGQTNEKNRQWLNHCLTCQGCRCAAYDPAEWKKITDLIKELRSRSANP